VTLKEAQRTKEVRSERERYESDTVRGQKELKAMHKRSSQWICNVTSNQTSINKKQLLK